MLSDDIYKEVIRLVSQDRTEGAIRILQEQLESDPDRDSSTYHSVILLISQYNNWENQRRTNLKLDVSELNRINGEILDIAKELAQPDTKLKVPEGYIPPPVVPKADPLEVAQNPVGNQPFIQSAVPQTSLPPKKESWATPTRILAVVGGLFLLILVVTLIFPDSTTPPNNLVTTGDTPPANFVPSTPTNFNYTIPNTYPRYPKGVQATAHPDPAGEVFITNLLANSVWTGVDINRNQTTISCNAMGNGCNATFFGTNEVELITLSGFADDGYAYLQSPNDGQGNPLEYALEFINDFSTLRLYVLLPPGTAASEYPVLDFNRVQ